MDTPFGPLVADYSIHLVDAREVTEYIYGKAKTKKYKASVIYLPLVLPLTKKCTVLEGPMEDPDVISSLTKIHPLAKLWAFSLVEYNFIGSDFKISNTFHPILPHQGNNKTIFNTSLTFSLCLLCITPLEGLGYTYTQSTL